MAKHFTPPIVQIGNDDFSGVGAGWKLSFFSTGTLTRKDTFSDADLTTANANPVVADSSGRFGSIFLEDGTYRVVLTDADDVEKWDEDDVEGAAGASGVVDEIDEDHTVVLADSTKILNVDASGAARTITLLAAATAGDGFEVTIKKSDNSANTVTIDGNGAETIDGETTRVLSTQYATVTVRSDGSNWQIVSFGGVVTARGDIIRGSSDGDPERLALGAAGTYLRSDGTDASWAALEPIVQQVNSQDGAVATGTTLMVVDDTIPQNDEGDEYITQAITPTNASNILEIDVVMHLANSATGHLVAALFQDSTADALAVGRVKAGANDEPVQVVFRHRMTAGTTSATTFKVRAGGNQSGTTTFNGVGGSQHFGGVLASSITIKEIAA